MELKYRVMPRAEDIKPVLAQMGKIGSNLNQIARFLNEGGLMGDGLKKEIVTERIIEKLSEGYIPWHRKWMSVGEGAFNRVSKKPYSILNQMLLDHEGEYATIRQWNALGGHIKKGAKSEFVVFWKLLDKDTGKGADNDDGGGKIPLLRYYNVFHISQVEGVKPLEINLKDTAPVDEAEAILQGYVEHEHISLEISLTNRAYYSPSKDVIHLPDIRQYDNPNDYYSVAFHEACHSTGHKTRLARYPMDAPIAPFGSEDYSKEELVAEFGSAAIMNRLGLETDGTFTESAAYIQNWISVLKNDNRFIVSASSKADKAVKLILGKAAA